MVEVLLCWTLLKNITKNIYTASLFVVILIWQYFFPQNSLHCMDDRFVDHTHISLHLTLSTSTSGNNFSRLFHWSLLKISVFDHPYLRPCAKLSSTNGNSYLLLSPEFLYQYFLPLSIMSVELELTAIVLQWIYSESRDTSKE